MNKDNFTDVIENVPQAPISPANTGDAQQSAPQQVVGNNGETITLGQK